MRSGKVSSAIGKYALSNPECFQRLLQRIPIQGRRNVGSVVACQPFDHAHDDRRGLEGGTNNSPKPFLDAHARLWGDHRQLRVKPGAPW